MATPAVTQARAYLKARQKSVRDAMKQLDLDGLLITNRTDITYLSGFGGDDSVALVMPREIYLVTDFRYKEQAEMEAGWMKMVLREGKMSDAIVQALEQARPKRLGFDANFTTVGQLKAVETALAEKKLAVALVGTENILANIRKVKDDHEVELIRKAIDLAQEAFEAVRAQLAVGHTENYLAGLMHLELRSRGASDASFPVIVAAGPNSSLPHYRPGEALVKKDQPLLFDWGALTRGYCSDLTRTLLVGRVSDRLRTAYRVVLEAQEMAIKFLRPGVTTQQADRVAREVIEKAGFGDQFGHGLGHGIGLDVHEAPSMRKTGSEEELRPGMVLTVEPGIYLPGEGGIRIEDNVLITHSGCEVLSSLPKSLEDCQVD